VKTLRRSIGSIVLLCATVAFVSGCAAGSRSVYEGTYVRTWVELDGRVAQESSHVRLVLDEGGGYEIRGDRPGHPPAGRGRYVMNEDGTLVLDDRGFTTAGFDLSLVLSGTFSAARDGDTLVLRQENTWGHTHHLLLERTTGEPR
jgi:hypothetical protein